MTRKRYSWDIACEADESTQSQAFYESLHGIIEYFYSFKDILEIQNIAY